MGSVVPKRKDVNSGLLQKLGPGTNQTQLAEGTNIALTGARNAPIKHDKACRSKCVRINVPSTELAGNLSHIFAQGWYKIARPT